MSTRTLTLLFTALVAVCAALGVMWSLAVSEQDELREQLRRSEQKRQAQVTAMKRLQSRSAAPIRSMGDTHSSASVDTSRAHTEEAAGAERVAELEKMFREALEKKDRAALMGVLEGVLNLNPAGYPAMVPVLNTLYKDKTSLEEKMAFFSESETDGGFMNMDQDSIRIFERIMSGGMNPLVFFLASSDELNPEWRASMLESVGDMANRTNQEKEAAELLGHVLKSETDGQLFDAALKGLGKLATDEAIAILDDKLKEVVLSGGPDSAEAQAISMARNTAFEKNPTRSAEPPTEPELLSEYNELSEDVKELEDAIAAETETESPTVSNLRWTAEEDLEGRSALLQDAALKARLVEMATLDADPARRTEALGLLVYGLSNEAEGETEVVAIIDQNMLVQSVPWRQSAVVALGQIRSTEAVEQLKRIQAQDPDENTRKLATIVLNENPIFSPFLRRNGRFRYGTIITETETKVE